MATTNLAQKKIQITERTSRTMVENQLRIGLDVVCYQRGTKRERERFWVLNFSFLFGFFFFSSRTREHFAADLVFLFSLFFSVVSRLALGARVVFFLHVRFYRYI